MLETREAGKIKGAFYVASYQRGYRWTDLEVTKLLEDLRGSEGGTYYLQPVVVKRRGEGSWELVDGQQRLTTLYMLLQYLRSHVPTVSVGYSLEYETRPGSKAYLDVLDEELSETNIDFAHMFRAHRCIEEWFEQFGVDAPDEAIRMYIHLGEGAKILWYEAPSDVDAVELFTRLNVGRIPLTDAELVKAHLLNHAQTRNGKERAQEIAAHWDIIERDLRVPELWAFLTGQPKEDPTHISLLLDTLAEVPREERLPFQTYEMLRSKIDQNHQEFWRSVVNVYSLVMGWYDDRQLFHKIGYLIASGRRFDELYLLSKGRGRSDFEAVLDEEIRALLRLTRDDVRELGYGKRKTQDVLLLMNVETVRTKENSSERYSFKAHAEGQWSLEHIHAQNAEALKTVEEWTRWLVDHRNALSTLPGVPDDKRQSLLASIDEALGAPLTKQVFNTLEKELIPLFTRDDQSGAEEMHSITNLALLDGKANSALNNSAFEVKRRRIIELDRTGSYIPPCTR
ncbi:MAG: DUF262 domain-containing protein, partial [Actinomycetota bacterium]|nr:DUF262 domain-containing protein [Actinomycetota bacterium]